MLSLLITAVKQRQKDKVPTWLLIVRRMSCSDRSLTQKSLLSVGRETRYLWLGWSEASGAAGAAPRPLLFPWAYQDKFSFWISRNNITAFTGKFSSFLQGLFSHSHHWESFSPCHNDKSCKEPFPLVKVLCRGLREIVRFRCHSPRVATLAQHPWQRLCSLTAPGGSQPSFCSHSNSQLSAGARCHLLQQHK